MSFFGMLECGKTQKDLKPFVDETGENRRESKALGVCTIVLTLLYKKCD
jgi:hypothetical protein